MRFMDMLLSTGLIAIVIATGCGSGGEATGDDSGGEALTAEYVKTASGICSRGAEQAEARAAAYEAKTGGPTPASAVAPGSGVGEAVIPVLERTIVQVARLDISSGDDEELSRFLLLYQDVAHTNQGVPIGSLKQLQGKFRRANAMARNLGLAACEVG